MPTGTMRSLFAESSSSSSSSSSGSGRDSREAEPAAAVLCAPRPRRVQLHPCSADLILGPPPFLLNSSGNNKKQREGKSKTQEEDEEEEAGGWTLFGGSPPARADNPLVHDPHFLLNQRHHAAAAASDISLAVFDSHRNNHHIPTYSNSSSHSFAPSYAPAVRIQGFDVSSCRSSHGSSGGRVLSARA